MTTAPSQNAASIHLLSMREVQAGFKAHRTTIYNWVKRKEFPQPIRVGGSLRWIADEIEAFKAERMASR